MPGLVVTSALVAASDESGESETRKQHCRPVHGRPWQYRFYLDLQASASDPEFAAALGELAQQAVELKVLGSYKSAETVSADKFISEGMQ